MKMKQRTLLTGAAVLLAATALIGCGGGSPAESQQGQVAGAPPAAATAATTTATATATQGADKSRYVGDFKLTPAAGTIGTSVKATGNGYAPNSDVALNWQDIKGRWNVKDDGTFHGRAFDEELVTLTTARTDARGSFETSFTVPDGFGYMHNVYVMQDGAARNQAGFNVKMEVNISPKEGPPGTPITIDVKGIGYQYLENSWQLTYDNRYSGWLSSVTTHGSARAVVAASGQPGTHVLQVQHGWSFVPYLNNAQSPRPDREMFTMNFKVTDGAAIMPPPPESQALPIERRDTPRNSGQPMIWTDIASGPIDTPLLLQGLNLPPGEVEVRWFRVTGNRVGGGGWAENHTTLNKGRISADGKLELAFKALDDLGGAHRIEAIVDGKVVATTSYTVTPSALALDRTSGPAGTIATLHLKGVGWTETANIYTVVYDGAYTGFACGFNSQGDVQVPIPIAGAPGWHFIELYPAIYKGVDVKGTENFRQPQLTYAKDHPGERLPAFRFAVLVTE